MTPYQAIAAIAELRADPVKAKALDEKSSANHKVVYDELMRLRKIAYPAQTQQE
jgi:hypothetical protein